MLNHSSALDSAFREYWATVVASLTEYLRDWDLAEECAQEAFAAAARAWGNTGIPDSPISWLVTTARNRAVDRIRRNNTYATKLELLTQDPGSVSPNPDETVPYADERLRLMFASCHPALSVEAGILLTLRYVSGIKTVDLAKAFLTSEEAMAKRLTRTKKRIQQSETPLDMPGPDELPERLEIVLRVLYQLFNEGYSIEAGSNAAALRAEAIFLARDLKVIFPQDPEVGGLLSLMLFQDARTPARFSPGMRFVPLAEQDRALVDQIKASEAQHYLDEATARRVPGPYQIQSAIAWCHVKARTYEETNWAEITSLYGQLMVYWDTPVIHLNRAVAMSNLLKPADAIVLFDQLASAQDLGRYHLYHASRAELLRRAARTAEARNEYETAMHLTRNQAERSYLKDRIASLSTGEV